MSNCAAKYTANMRSSNECSADNPSCDMLMPSNVTCREKKRKSRGHILNEYVQHTTMHGVWHLTNPKATSRRRMFWLVALAICLSLLLYTFIEQLGQYIKYPVRTVLLVEEATSLDFPAITICNYNQFRKSAVMKNPQFAQTLRELFPIPLPFVVSKAMDGINTTTKIRRLMNRYGLSRSITNLSYELVTLAHQLEDMFTGCFWLGQEVNCADYMHTVMTEIGVCYTFNSQVVLESQGPLVVHDSGSDHSLRLRLNIQQNEYYHGRGTSAGVKVLVHHQRHEPLIRQYGYSVPPGFTTSLGVTKTTEELLPAPYGDCFTPVIDDVDNASTMQHQSVYTQEACKLQQKAHFVFTRCACKRYFDHGERVICANKEQAECVTEAEANYTAVIGRVLADHCPVPCHSEQYKVQLSSAAFPGQHIVDELTTSYGMTETDIRKNLLQIMVYYDDMSVRRWRQEPEYTFASLLSDLGGQMGLCLGASVLTVVEIIDFALLAICKISKPCR